jgi:hypothetical protein
MSATNLTQGIRGRRSPRPPTASRPRDVMIAPRIFKIRSV